MPKVLTYNDMTIELMQFTPYPAELLALALNITMKESVDEILSVFTPKKAKFLLEAEHASVFEHVIFTFLVQNMSRSLLAQITRQRTASPTSGSQHYQEYSDYPCTIRPDAPENAKELYRQALNHSYEMYGALLMLGEPREEARQVLPNAATTNYLWTIDARNLALFLRQRLCYRNVEEMQVFAERVLSLVYPIFPELFCNIGPQCFADTCKQGYMNCGRGPWVQA